jgi:hypothetical protein
MILILTLYSLLPFWWGFCRIIYMFSLHNFSSIWMKKKKCCKIFQYMYIKWWKFEWPIKIQIKTTKTDLLTTFN